MAEFLISGTQAFIKVKLSSLLWALNQSYASAETIRFLLKDTLKIKMVKLSIKSIAHNAKPF